MGSDRVRAYRKSSSTLTPGFKPEKSSFLQRRYQDPVESGTDSFTEEKQQNSSEQSNPRPPLVGHSFGRVSVLPIQPKLAIGQPGDKYEQEADRVADQVMRMPAPGSPVWGLTSLLQTPSIQRMYPNCEKEVQRQPMEEEEEEETLQTKPLANQITPLVQRQTEPLEEEEEDTLQTKTASNLVQRQTEPLEEEEEDTLQTKTASNLRVMRDGDGSTSDSVLVNREIEQHIQQERSSGQSLSSSIRTPMEQRFGIDFSGVKVHTNSTSDKLNRSLSARAFTTGQDIFFKKGEYNPTSTSGRGLLAHELTHVVQQGGAKLQRKPKLGQSESSSVLRHLQAMQQQPGFDTSLYRKEIAEFQQTHPTEQIMAKQGQILRKPEGVNVRERDNSQAIRRCARPPRGVRTGPPPAPAAGLTFSSGSFNKGTGGQITAASAGANLVIRSAAYSPSGSVKVSGSTNAEAQKWEVGFIQTLKSTTRAGHYKGSPSKKKLSVVVPTPIRDGNPKQSTSTPWYDSLNPKGKKAFTKTNSTENVSLWDKPGTGAPWKTPDKKGKLDYYDGKDIFTAWMIVREKASPNTIEYINWTSWEVDWGVTTNYASKGTKTVDKKTGSTKNTGSGAGKGSDTPVLSGPFPNTAAKLVWS